MSIVAWLKRLTRRRLDDEDFKQEIRAHLAIAHRSGWPMAPIGRPHTMRRSRNSAMSR